MQFPPHASPRLGFMSCHVIVMSLLSPWLFRVWGDQDRRRLPHGHQAFADHGLPNCDAGTCIANAVTRMLISRSIGTKPWAQARNH